MLVALSWFIASLAGFGLIPFLFVFRGGELAVMRSFKDSALAISLVLMWGAMIVACLGLWSGSLKVQFMSAWIGVAICCSLILATIAKRVFIRRAAPPAAQMRRTPPLAVSIEALGIGLLVAAVAAIGTCVFFLPLTAWDARSIWLFHGKVIYFAGGLHQGPFWQTAEYAWSHPDYPMLMPLMTAQMADFFGVWNEYAPKGAYMLLVVAGLAGLRAAVSSSAVFIPLALADVVAIGRQTWDGYLDGWLAIFGSIAVLALSSWTEIRGRANLILGLTALSFTLCFKNEAQVFTFIALTVTAAGLIRNRPDFRMSGSAFLLLLMPALSWYWIKGTLGLQGDLEAGNLLSRAMTVLSDPAELLRRLSFLAIKVREMSDLLRFAGLFFVLLCFAGFPARAVTAGAIATFYTVGLVGVYLGTPHDFIWHVNSSLDRVVLLPECIFIGASFELAAVMSRGMPSRLNIGTP